MPAQVGCSSLSPVGDRDHYESRGNMAGGDGWDVRESAL